MKKTTHRRLVLDRQTIRSLVAPQLARVVGGMIARDPNASEVCTQVCGGSGGGATEMWQGCTATCYQTCGGTEICMSTVELP